ncbi:MAG: hypothetical protein V4555_20575 [Acidobacteriota bacterium]
MHARTLLIALTLTAAASAQQSDWAHLNSSGHLIYKTTPHGDHIADFSYAGYQGGGVALPTAPVGDTLLPSGADDTHALQSELDHTAQLAAKAHHPIALLLAEGVFHLSKTINLSASNVVLRGSGKTKTILQLTGAPHMGIHIGPGTEPPAETDDFAPSKPEAPPAPSRLSTTLANTYIPSGTLTVPVTSAAGFAPGDTIELDHPITPAYVTFMGMNLPNRDGKPEHWIGNHITVERTIASISGNTLTLTVPLTDDYDPQYGGGPQTTVRKITPPTRLSQVAVESLSITAPSVKITISAVEDAWLRDLHLEDTINDIAVQSQGRRITIDHVDILQRIPIQSSAKNFGFSLAGTQTLVMHSSLTGDSIFFAATQAREQGPNVLLFCTFTGDQSIEPHQRWGTGFLVDNVNVHGGAINLLNRGTMGSGHGWAIGWGVVWNSTADTFIIQNPPGAINWAIGVTGKHLGRPMPISGAGYKGRPDLPEGLYDSPNHPVQPTSLYLQQLKDRLGPAAVKAIGY